MTGGSRNGLTRQLPQWPQESLADAKISAWFFCVFCPKAGLVDDGATDPVFSSSLQFLVTDLLVLLLHEYRSNIFLLGFPRVRFPSIFPSSTVFGRQSCLSTCPIQFAWRCLMTCTRQRWYNSAISWTYSTSRSSKVVDLGGNRKRICNFLLVNSSNFGRISYTLSRYRRIKLENS